uniref:Uncharacterized protein n=1 Tax=Arundo donax TaxID=35708 RepID=A0A0A9B897_ARUDO
MNKEYSRVEQKRRNMLNSYGGERKTRKGDGYQVFFLTFPSPFSIP